MGVSTKEYSNGEITVLWKPGMCIHSAKCVKGLPNVFNINSSPWIDASGASTDEIIEQVSHCPSGALSIKKEESIDEEQEAIATVITTTNNGPILVEGDFSIVDADGNTIPTRKKAYLCRCGHSANKPFCDSSHKRVEFES
jgi:uncharacterized Fe-S cluster protein YjdI